MDEPGKERADAERPRGLPGEAVTGAESPEDRSRSTEPGHFGAGQVIEFAPGGFELLTVFEV